MLFFSHKLRKHQEIYKNILLIFFSCNLQTLFYRKWNR